MNISHLILIASHEPSEHAICQLLDICEALNDRITQLERDQCILANQISKNKRAAQIVAALKDGT